MGNNRKKKGHKKPAAAQAVTEPAVEIQKVVEEPKAEAAAPPEVAVEPVAEVSSERRS